MTVPAHSPGARRARRLGPLALLLPLLLLLLGLLHLTRREPLSGPARPPEVSSPDETVSALVGELAGGGGGWLAATLAPLHADPERQAFEARALERELGLEPGQPWRLSVRWDVAAEAAQGSPGPDGVAQGTGPERAAQAVPAGIELGALSIEDEQGVALRSLEPPRPGDGAPASPLRTLLAPPTGALRPGQTADWMLWGRAPGTGARVVGLVPAADELFRASTGFQGPFPLRATRVRRGDLGQPLARLERAPGGKRAPAGASEAGDGPDHDDGR